MRLTSLDYASNFKIIGSNTTIAPNVSYLINTNFSAITLNLPSQKILSDGDRIVIADLLGTFHNHNCTLVAGEGTKLFGDLSSYTYNTDFSRVEIFYKSGVWLPFNVSTKDILVKSVNNYIGDVRLRMFDLEPSDTVSDNFNPVVNRSYLVDTSTKAITATLPNTGLTDYDTITFIDKAGTNVYNNTGWGKNSFTINGNGNSVQGLSSQIFDLDLQAITIAHKSGSWTFKNYSATPRIIKQEFRTLSQDYTVTKNDHGQFIFVSTLCNITLPRLFKGFQCCFCRTSVNSATHFIPSVDGGTLYGKGTYLSTQYASAFILSLNETGDYQLIGDVNVAP